MFLIAHNHLIEPFFPHRKPNATFFPISFPPTKKLTDQFPSTVTYLDGSSGLVPVGLRDL